MPESQITAQLIDHMGTDLTVSNAARVSFGKRREEFLYKGDPRIRPSGRSDEELIEDLAREGHFSPFGHCFASFHVKAPIFVARQLVKHKFLRWNEISRRYVDSEPEFFIPVLWRTKPKDKKQGSGSYFTDETFDKKTEDHITSCLALYKNLLDEGIAPEMARMVLPLNTMTEWYWSGSLDAFADMCKLRLKFDTQYETQIVAQQIDAQMKLLFPVSWAALLTLT
jgi:thymidylate synthase (FAD)